MGVASTCVQGKTNPSPPTQYKPLVALHHGSSPRLFHVNLTLYLFADQWGPKVNPTLLNIAVIISCGRLSWIRSGPATG